MVEQKYSKKDIKELLKKHSSKKDLKTNNFYLYHYILDRGWTWKEIASHFKQEKRNSRTKWTKKNILFYANKCRNITEFMGRYPKGYLSAKELELIPCLKKEIFENKEKYKYKVYTLDSVMNIAKGCRSNSEFRNKFPGPYQQAYQQGWLPTVIDFLNKKMNASYNKDKIIIQASIMKSNLSYKNKHPFEYEFLRFNDLLSEVNRIRDKNKKEVINKLKGKKTKTSKKHAIRYSEDEILEVAKKYSSRQSFHVNAKGHYLSALNKGIIDKACSHMNKKINFMEEYVRKAFEYVLKDKFLNTRPSFLINPKTNRRLELDGFSPKLKIAFEYQGPYHDPSSIMFKKEVEEKDKIKQKLCKKFNIELFLFYGKSIKSLRKELKKALKVESLPEFSI